jgi:TPR repeat protein
LINIKKVKAFVSSLSEKDIESDELIKKSNKFFAENCSEIDTEFINSLMENKSKGTNIGIELMENYAYKGSPAAQLAIGSLKFEGKGVEQNIPEAIFWIKRAYISNNPKSGIMLSSIYSNGIGVQECMIKSREYMKGSADLGVPKAQYYYAGMLLEGEGGPVDEDEAIDYMFLAANNGSEEAIEFLTVNELIEPQS